MNFVEVPLIDLMVQPGLRVGVVEGLGLELACLVVTSLLVFLISLRLWKMEALWYL